jgi:glycosyltransferase involved in cell wall biosynthesis
MMKTADKLRSLGTNVDYISEPGEVRAKKGYDILHVFNLPFSGRASKFLKVGDGIGLTTVISPIYWDFSHSIMVKWLSKVFYNPGTLQVTRKARVISKLVLTLRSIAFNNINFDPRPGPMREAIQRADLLLPNSHAELAKLCEHINVSKNDLRPFTNIVHNAIDIKTFTQSSDTRESSLGIDTQSTYLLEVGRICPNKNQKAVMEIAERLEVPVIFVGDDTSKYARELKTRARGSEYTQVYGRIKQHKLKRLYEKADVHVLPSFRESPGLVSLEAAYCGAEIVVSNDKFCPVKEYFETNAHTCNPYSLSSIEKAIKDAVHNNLNSSDFRKKIESKFNWQQTANNTLKAYEDVIASP